MIYGYQRDFFIIFGLCSVIIFQSLQQNSHSALLQQKIMELNATIQTYSEANKQIEDISDESSSSSKELAQNHGLTKFNEENSFWKSASETWQGFSEHYQKIAAENAENLKLCSDKAKMQEETIEELNALLDQNIKQKNLLEFLKNHYKDCWERQSYYC